MRTLIAGAASVRLPLSGPLFVLFSGIILLSLACPRAATPFPAIFEIVLNQQNMGTFFVEATDDGDYLLKKNDFAALGLPVPESGMETVDGEEYYPLSGQQNLDVELNEQSLTLEITVRPDILPLSRIDFTSRRPEHIVTPSENSLLLNYGISATGNRDDSLQVVDLSHELAARSGKSLFVTDGIYSRTDVESGYTRLLTRMIRDDRETQRRLVAGDHYVLSGPLGGQVLIGGAGFGRNFDLDPYSVHYPSIHLQGTADTPSEIEIYVDGMLIRKEKLPPGPFVLENLTRYEGAGDVDIVIRDAFNREVRIEHPFYLAESLLVPGEHEFSYNVGALRELFGIESNEYGDTVFSGFHRYGIRDWLTLGVSGEYGPDFFSLAPRLSLKWKHYGFFDLSFGSSSGDSTHAGTATAIEYLYRDRRFSTGFRLRNFSEHYARLDDLFRTDRLMTEGQVRFGYSTPLFGSLNLAYTASTFHNAGDRDETSLTYNRRLARYLSMYVTANLISANQDETIVIAGFSYSPWREKQLSARIEERENSRLVAIGLQKDPPTGAGYGYRAAIDVFETDVSDSYSLNAAGQWNARHGILRAETDLASVDGEFSPSWQASAGGAVAVVGGTTRLTRPIRDSFVLVKVGELEGVRVVRNSEEIDRTDEKGYALVPEVTSFYDNQIAVRDEDIPIEYGLENTHVFVQPPLRSGACVIFNATRIQPLTGTFRVIVGGKEVPYEFRPLTVRFDGRVLQTQTGYDGEFYIDVSEAGAGQSVLTGCEQLQASGGESVRELLIDYDYDGLAGTFELEIPASDALFISMGDLFLNGPKTEGR